MKRILLFAIAILFCGVLQSQVFKDASDYSRTTVVGNIIENFVPYTQKTLPFKENIHISLSKNSNNVSVFTWLENDNVDFSRSVELEEWFDVKDFAIYESNIYFCGSVSNNSLKEAFIAYINIEELFLSHSESIKYTRISNIPQDSVYSVDRIEVFYNQDSNEVVLAGIGKMYYGEPTYQTVGDDPLSGNLNIVDLDEYYLDFFMFYTIKEEQVITNKFDYNLGANPIYASANAMEMFYVPTDTLQSCYFTKFADITETDNRIYLTAINYSNTNIMYASHADYVNIISFDKITRQQQTTKIAFPFEIHQELGVKTTHLYDDEIAVVVTKCDEPSSIAEGCAFKVTPIDGDLFEISNLSLFDPVYGKPIIFDCEYLDATKELIVLKNSEFDGKIEEIIFHLNIVEDITSPYTSYKYRVNNMDNNNNDTLYWCDLQSSNVENYTVSGARSDDNLLFHDMRYDAITKELSCFKQDQLHVYPSSEFRTESIPILEECRFSYLTPVIVNSNQLFILYGSTPIYNAIIEETFIQEVNELEIDKICSE